MRERPLNRQKFDLPLNKRSRELSHSRFLMLRTAHVMLGCSNPTPWVASGRICVSRRWPIATWAWRKSTAA